jgi:hypothetical protein
VKAFDDICKFFYPIDIIRFIFRDGSVLKLTEVGLLLAVQPA